MQKSTAVLLPVAFFAALFVGLRMADSPEPSAEGGHQSAGPTHRHAAGREAAPGFRESPDPRTPAGHSSTTKSFDHQEWVSLEAAGAPSMANSTPLAGLARRYQIAGLSTEELIEALPPRYRDGAQRYRRDLNQFDPDYRRYICWGPGTPKEVVETYRRIEIEGGLAPGETRVQATQFLISDHWSRTATNGTGNVSQGLPVTLTWSIVPDGTSAPDDDNNFGGSNLRSWLAGLYGGSTTGDLTGETWFGHVKTAVDRIGEVSGINFVYEPNDDGAGYTSGTSGRGLLGTRGDIRLAARAMDGDFGTLAFAYFPDYGDVVFDSSDGYFTAGNPARMINTLSHEIGHAVGLDHVCPINNTKLMEPFASSAFDGPQFDDVFSLQRLYGDPLELPENPPTSNRNNDSVAAATPITVSSGSQSFGWLSIDDNNDVDYLKINVPIGQQITLRLIPSDPVGGTYLEGAQNSDGSCSGGVSFDPRSRHNLTLELLNATGTTTLAQATSAAAGQTEEILDYILPSGGDFLIRINGDSSDTAQLYQLEVELETAPNVPSLIVASQTILDESNLPNNAAADPGETIRLQVTVTNVGSLAASSVATTLSGPAGFTGFETSGNVGSIGAGASHDFTFVFAQDGTCGDDLTLDLGLTAAGGYDFSTTLVRSLGSTPATLNEGFEGSSSVPAGWSSTTSGSGSGWSTPTGNADQGSRAAFADSVSTVGESILASPASTLGTDSELSFRHDFDLENGYDGAVLEYSLDGGGWSDLIDPLPSGVTVIDGDYNDDISTNFSSPIGGRDAWSGNSSGYQTVRIGLPDTWSGSSIRFRWRLAHDSSQSVDGWWVDSVDLDTTASTCTDFRPALSVSTTATSLTEGESTTATLSTPLPLAQAVPVTLEISGDAVAADLTSSVSLVLPAGSTELVFPITADADGNSEGTEALTLTVPASEPGFAAAAPAALTLDLVDPASGYSVWAATYPGLSPDVEVDDDGDGWSALAEYLFGTHPLQAGDAPQFTTELDATSLSIVLPTLPTRADATIIGETSTTLSSWTTVGVTTEADGFSVPRSGTQRFLRLRFELTSP